MHFEKSQELERRGQWKAAVEEMLRLGVTRPVLWSAAWMEVARLLRVHAGRPAGLLFSSRGLAPESARWLAAQKWVLPEDIFDSGSDEPTDIVHEAHQQEKDAGADQAIAWAAARAKGAEVAALALMLARRHVADEALWLSFFNAYLAAHDLAIDESASLRASSRFARLRSARPSAPIHDGPLVSVLMPVHEAAATVREAAASILNQDWRSLELIMIDDASQDGSWAVCEEIARSDSRVKIHRNPVNVGPYVSKNVAMQLARGQYITCHDADDWAFPERIAHQMSLLLHPDAKHKATSGRMLRLGPDGDPTRPSRVGPSSEDGFIRPCFVSLLVERAHFERHLGAWDNIRVAADSELMERAMRAPGGVLDDSRILMLCLDLEGGLTRHPTFGLASSQRLRPRYLRAWRRAHASQPHRLRYPFLPANRLYEAPEELVVPRAALEAVMAAVGMDMASLPREAPAPLPLVEDAVAPTLHKHNALAEFADLEARIGTDPAIEAAERSLTRDIRPVANVLHANAALARGDRSAWLAYLNKYLQRFALAPIRLRDPVNPWWTWATDPLTPARKGPSISVLLNVEHGSPVTEASIEAVLGQSWRHLELIVVHDEADAALSAALGQRARQDSRLKPFGVSRGIGVADDLSVAAQLATGEWLALHDESVWMHPQRLERQMLALLATGAECQASVAHVLPVDERGYIGPFASVGPKTFDGAAQRSPAGLLIRRDAFDQGLAAHRLEAPGSALQALERLIDRLGKAELSQRLFAGLRYRGAARLQSHS